MISFTPDGQHLTVHRLLQTVLRTRTEDRAEGRGGPGSDGTGPAGRQEAEHLLHTTLPDGQDTPPAPPREQLLPHITALLESTPPDGTPSPQAAACCFGPPPGPERQPRRHGRTPGDRLPHGPRRGRPAPIG
ncbi:hypothetical protein [Actinacidiphila sp. ITFR-21]|uniref:hypothetical protein n=1 Tax=Actinacidiphila sp. ITFR-21 TaxID=3075199 RepID=UPI00288B70D7|nr:hypothetical protein [Streptomyces sp. ITFR-21]WNI15175.1 hypothetical protein RLT57_06260 [Streptomyces sp. ITFR-21]